MPSSGTQPVPSGTKPCPVPSGPTPCPSPAYPVSYSPYPTPTGYPGVRCYTPCSRAYTDRRYYCRPRRYGSWYFLSLGYFIARPWWGYSGYRSSYGDWTGYSESYAAADRREDGGVAYAQDPGQFATGLEPTAADEALLQMISEYLAAHSPDGKFRIADAQLDGRIWALELAQPPAVFSMDENHYTVLAAFQGLLYGTTTPAGVDLQFFLSRPAPGTPWRVDDVHIQSANGLVRPPLPAPAGYPQVSTKSHG
ncbi:MAG: hypothetical protein HY319_03640 [Armatimonadetes bacterium]|nr:hypothetical protein [Armatimonadota bacterium]